MNLSDLMRPKITPKPHQWQTRNFLLGNQWNYNLSQMGTGKTLAEVLALRELYIHDAVKRILVVAPLSVIGCVWDEHMQDFAPEVPRLLLNQSYSRGKLMGTAGDGVLLINPDGVVSLCNALHVWRPQLVIIDEVAGYYRNMVGSSKNPKTGRREHNQRWAAMSGLLERHGRIPTWPMTGTPLPKDLMDCYSQLMLCTPWRLPKRRNGSIITYVGLRDQLHTQPYPDVWKPRPGALEYVYEMMQPAVRFTRKQVMSELDEPIRSRRQVPLSPDQKRMISELQAATKTTYGDATIKGVDASVLTTKITQIACGAVYACGDKVAYPPATARLEEVCRIQEEAGGSPIILAVPFIHVAKMLQSIATEKFKKRVAVIIGETPPNERTRLVREFQAGGLDWIVCHPKTAAHGLTLTRSHTVVWYAPIDDQELVAQLNDRISRFGQEEKPCVIELYSTPAELKVYKRNESKEALQGKFLDFFE